MTTMGGKQPPELFYGAPETLSSQVAAWLRTRILAGDFEPDRDPLPSEKQLIEMFGISRPTARRAIEILREEGLVYTLPQRGSYVYARSRRPRPERPHAPPSDGRRSGRSSNGPPKSSRARSRLALADGGVRSCQRLWATQPLSRFMLNDIPYAGMHPRAGFPQEFM